MSGSTSCSPLHVRIRHGARRLLYDGTNQLRFALPRLLRSVLQRSQFLAGATSWWGMDATSTLIEAGVDSWRWNFVEESRERQGIFLERRLILLYREPSTWTPLRLQWEYFSYGNIFMLRACIICEASLHDFIVDDTESKRTYGDHNHDVILGAYTTGVEKSCVHCTCTVKLESVDSKLICVEVCVSLLKVDLRLDMSARKKGVCGHYRSRTELHITPKLLWTSKTTILRIFLDRTIVEHARKLVFD